MATLFDRLNVNLSGGGFTSALSGQVGQFAAIAAQAGSLVENPAGLGDFAAGLAGLATPALPNGSGIAAGLNGARGAIPGVADRAGPGALAEIGRFGELVATRLTPLLASTVAVARAIEGLAGAQFRCPPAEGAAAPAPAPAPPPPPPAGPAPPAPPAPPGPGPARLAVAGERAAQVTALLALLPNPLTPGAVLDSLVTIGGPDSRDATFPITIPIFEDLVQPLAVLGRWSKASPAEVGTQLADTLGLLRDRLRQASTGRLDAALTNAVGLRTQLPAAALAAFVTDYLAAANSLASALGAGNAGAAAAAAGQLDAAVAAYEAVRAGMAAAFTGKVPDAATALRAAPGEVLDGLLHLAIQIEPVHPSSFVPAAATVTDADAAEQLTALLEPITDFLEDLAEKLDLSAITGGVGDVATQCREIADSINEALVAVAQETRAAFAQVEAVVRELPFDDLAAEMRSGIAEAGDALEAAVRSAFEPFRDAIASAVESISGAVDEIDPAAVTDALAQAVSEITAILNDQAVQDAVKEIRGVLDSATEAARNLSFAPVTDEVIALIEKMTSGLKAVATAELNDTIKGLLATALMVLPPDLRPVTQPLVDDFGVAIEQGPVPLLEQIREKPKEVMDLVRGFNPGALAGGALGPPFREALGRLEGFTPSALLAPLRQALDAEKARLKAETAPSKALAPITEAFDQLLAELDRLSPDALLRPLEEQVEKAIRDVIEASPVDEVFEQINGVFATIQAVLDTIAGVGTALRSAATALAGFADPNAALDSWRDAILAKIDGVPNKAALTVLLGQIEAAIDEARLDDLLARFDAGAAALVADLAAVDAEAKLAAMVTVRQRLRPLVTALAAGAGKSAIEAALARFDPMDPAHNGGLRAASDLARAVREGRAALAAFAPDFDRLLYGTAGALTALRAEVASADLLRSAVEQETEGALGPVRFVFAKLGGASVPVGAVAAALAELNSRVTASLGAVLTGPASLQTISQAVQGVVDTMRNIDFGFLRESLEGVFQAVRSEIEAAGPGRMLLALDREFSDAIDLLDFDLLLPAAQVAALDSAAESLVAKLRALDPEKLVGDALGPAFERDVLPLVEAIDITPVFDALIEALRSLEVELEGELARVNTAYQALLAARPAGLSAGAALGF